MSEQSRPGSSDDTDSLPDTDDHPLTGQKVSDMIVMFRLVRYKGKAPIPFTYIANFINHCFGRYWTSEQVLKRFVDLRHDYNIREEGPGDDPHKCFFRWDQQFRDDTANAELKKTYKKAESEFSEDFAATWSNEDDAAFSMTEEELVCEDYPLQLLGSTSFFQKCMGKPTMIDKWLDKIYEDDGPHSLDNSKDDKTTQEILKEALENKANFEKRRKARLEEMRKELKRHVGQPTLGEFVGPDDSEAS
ncbi:MAG: hypothetical protein Q9174_005321 [Haloplaca sp. 1 TL-2023]